jgi:hypothetical protein
MGSKLSLQEEKNAKEVSYTLLKEFLTAFRKSNTRIEMFQKMHHISDKAKKYGI